MSEQEREPRDACRRYAPTLAVLEDAGADADERRAALDHLATCARCQADQRAYARLNADLRHAFGPASASPLRTADLLMAIGATREPVAPSASAPARPARSVIRSVIYLGDFYGGFDDLGGFDSMSETEQRDAERSAPARRVAPIPSLRPGPGERASQRRWTVGFSASAVAVALIVVAVILFATHARPTATQTAHGAATQTAGAQGATGIAAGGPIVAISMDSPTDGWAIGQTASSGPITMQTVQAMFYHYDGSQWTLKQQVQGFQANVFQNGASLRMFSETDGWAFDGGSQVLRYDGTTWKPETITAVGNQQIAQLLALDVVSPTQGWAVARLSSDSPQGALGFLRYDGQQWTVESASFSLPRGLDLNTLNIARISAASGGDAWAMGWASGFSTPNTQTNPPQVGLIFHRANGVWRLEHQVGLPSGATSMQFNDILMTGPNSGWIVGQTTESKTQIGGGVTTVLQPLLLRYDGSGWASVPAPADVIMNDDTLQQIVETGPDNIWVVVNTNGSTIGSNGVAVSATFLHYNGKTWSVVTPTLTVTGVTSAAVESIGLAPDGQLWAVGATETVQNQQGSVGPFFCLYANGAWGVVTPVASSK